jgi:hypothetical protein
LPGSPDTDPADPAPLYARRHVGKSARRCPGLANRNQRVPAMEESRKILSQSIGATIAAVVVIAVGVGIYYWRDRHPAETVVPPAPVAPAPAPPPVAADQPYQNPIDDSAADHTLTLEQSDARFLEGLTHLGGWRSSALRLILPTDIIRHIVATVDALPREKIAVSVMPVEPVAGAFRTSASVKGLAIAPANEERYAPYVGLLTSLDSRQLVDLYRRFYPLFQKAYQDLGYPKGYFNDRLVEVIDVLLESPEPVPPVAVVAPSAMYKYFDADLESLPAGQKVLVRVGPAHEKAIKAKLREIRQLIAKS